MFQCLDKAQLASYSTLKHPRKSSLNFLDLKILDTAQAQSLRPTLIPGHKPAARKTEEHVTKYSVMKRSQGEISTGTTSIATISGFTLPRRNWQPGTTNARR